jgi:hypothetical protein
MSKPDAKLTLAEQVIDKLKELKQDCCGKLLDWNGVYIELGRHQVMYYHPFRAGVDQITIRDIKLNKKNRKKGVFTALVRHLLETVGAVQLESIQNKWLLARLVASTLWRCNTVGEEGKIGSCYVRKMDNSIPFTLF